MRELTVEEMGQVGGGYTFDDILGDATNLATKTGFVGSIIGYAVTGSYVRSLPTLWQATLFSTFLFLPLVLSSSILGNL